MNSLNLNKRRWASTVIFSLLVFVLVFASFHSVVAHTEGKMQLSAEPAGPFKMTVFTSPDPAIVGDIHVAALIFLAEDASPLLDADVMVEMRLLDDSGPAMKSPAVLGEAENKLLFESILDVTTPGLYLVTVTVEEGSGQKGEASFELEVTSEGGFNWLYLVPVILVGGVVLVWAQNRYRRRKVELGRTE